MTRDSESSTPGASGPVPERTFLGIPFTTLDLPAVVQMLTDRPAHAPFAYIATPNAHHLGLLHRDVEGFAFGLSHAWFLTCDSRVLQRLGQLLFGVRVPVVTGSDLTLHLLRQKVAPDNPVTIIGGDESLRRDLARKFGLSQIVLHNPPMGFSQNPTQMQRCIDFVRENPARFVFLACGAPQSEVLAAHIARAPNTTGTGLCIGAALLFATDRLKRAPRFWQITSLEWLYRLMQEPKRLAPRLWYTQLPALKIAIASWNARRRGDPNLNLLARYRETAVTTKPLSVQAARATTVAAPAEVAEPIEVSIVIPCYDRMALLERTLRACFAQNVPNGLRWEIVVSDNHPDQLARDLVLSLQARSPVSLRYVPAPARNIALARNVGVAAASGRYVAFVDDDEAPEPGWLAGYHACMERTGADAAFGPKYPVFASGAPPEWDKQGRYYTTDFQVPADSQIGIAGRNGRALGTGNSIFRVSTCLNEAKPFNERNGAIDGEDTEFFLRLRKAGRHFIWCPDAVVREFMQENRLTFSYMSARLMRGSRVSVRCRASVSDHRRATILMMLGVGLAQVVVHSTLHVLTGDFLTRRGVKHRLGIARGLGKLTYRTRPTDFIEERLARASRPQT